MDVEQQGVTIEELAERVGVPVRTVRFYIAQGLIPGPDGRGKSAAYGEEHLLRLRLIRRLSEQRVPLAEQRDRLAGLSVQDLRELLAQEERHSADLRLAESAPSARDYVSALLSRARAARGPQAPTPPPSYSQLPPATPAASPAPLLHPPAPSAPSAQPRETESRPWRRWELAPGVELHVREDARERERSLVERLLRAAGKLFSAGER